MPSISPAEPFSLRDYLGFVQFSFDDPVQLGNHTISVNLRKTNLFYEHFSISMVIGTVLYLYPINPICSVRSPCLALLTLSENFESS